MRKNKPQTPLLLKCSSSPTSLKSHSRGKEGILYLTLGRPRYLAELVQLRCAKHEIADDSELNALSFRTIYVRQCRRSLR